MSTYNEIISLSNFSYNINVVSMNKLGNNKKFPNAEHNWYSTTSKKLPHWNYNRIWYVTKGSAYVKTTFGNFNLEENHAYFIPGGCIISTHCPNYMEQYYVDFMSYSSLIPMETLFNFVHIKNDCPHVLAILKLLMPLYNDNSPLSVLKTTSYMNALISEFILDIALTQNKTNRFLPILDYINTHKNTTVSELSEIFHYNAEYFSRLFKSTFGISPQTYIINKRIIEAKHLLWTTDFSITYIANLCGYNNPLNFSNAFKSKVGLSPSVFRNFIKSNNY